MHIKITNRTFILECESSDVTKIMKDNCYTRIYMLHVMITHDMIKCNIISHIKSLKIQNNNVEKINRMM